MGTDRPPHLDLIDSWDGKADPSSKVLNDGLSDTQPLGCATGAAGIPGPTTIIATRTHARPCVALTVTMAPAGANVAALESKPWVPYMSGVALPDTQHDRHGHWRP